MAEGGIFSERPDMKSMLSDNTCETTFPGMGVSLAEKTQQAIDLLREHESEALKLSPDGFYLAFSGGKDSVVIEHLARISGVKHQSWYSQTTIDPPELVRFIKRQYPYVKWNRPKQNFFVAALSKSMPTRIMRWCCEKYKESAGDNLIVILGVRAAESLRRRKQWNAITLWRNHQTGYAVCPIVHWSDQEVWDYIRMHHLPYCSLYDEGWKRLGCIGCPMAGKGRFKEFARWPGFEKAWKLTAKKIYESHFGKVNSRGLPYFVNRFPTWQDYWNWWINDENSSEDDQQQCLGLFDE